MITEPNAGPPGIDPEAVRNGDLLRQATEENREAAERVKLTAETLHTVTAEEDRIATGLDEAHEGVTGPGRDEAGPG